MGKSKIMEQVNNIEVQKMLSNGALLIDIRETAETAREFIKDAALWPLTNIPNQQPVIDDKQQVIYFCRSGKRTLMNKQKLKNALPNNAYVLKGGIDAWRNANMPTIINKKAPIELQKQIFIVAGLLMLLGTALTVNDLTLGVIITSLVGAGLAVAGITGYCGMARVLMLMPWNKVKRT